MRTIRRAARYWHTLRHLKPVQFYGRLRFRLSRPKLKAQRPAVRKPIGQWVEPTRPAQTLFGPDRVRFLGEEGTVKTAADWNAAGREKLWLYNLHYFDDLTAIGAANRADWHRALIGRWIAENPPGHGNGWEPYPISLRLVNWVKWLAERHVPVAGMAPSMADQANWLAQRMEWHLLGNHLFVNAKALIFAGLAFEHAEARDWLKTGLRIVAAQLPEQVLPDGGNFERSPMYHAIFLVDLLDLVNAAMHWPGQVPTAMVGSWRETAARMLDFLDGMSHPDGEISLFNDAAVAVAPPPAEIRAYATRLGIGVRTDASVVRHWPDAGYVRVEQGAAVTLIDVAPVGPDYLPGHAHADTLSFELSLGGRRLIVNGGTSRYGTGPERLAERGTRSHSTVEVAGQDSSEVWSGFRVARRAYPFDVAIDEQDGVVTISGAHDGYRRLPGRPVHRRSWWFDGGLTVEDRVTGGAHDAVARYILHPAVEVGDDQVLMIAGRPAARVTVEHGTLSVEDAAYAERFGQRVATRALAVALVDGRARLRLEWL